MATLGGIYCAGYIFPRVQYLLIFVLRLSKCGLYRGDAVQPERTWESTGSVQTAKPRSLGTRCVIVGTCGACKLLLCNRSKSGRSEMQRASRPSAKCFEGV